MCQLHTQEEGSRAQEEKRLIMIMSSEESLKYIQGVFVSTLLENMRL